MAAKEDTLVISHKRADLTEEQCQLWREVFAQRKQVQEAAQGLDAKIQSMMVAAGWAGMDIIEGSLGDDAPYFMLKPSEAIPTE